MDTDRVIAHVDMDAYFASIEQQTNPFLRGKPVLVCGNPRTKTVVAAASYEAKRMGVKSGMSITEATDLCPEAVLVPGDPVKYSETSCRIFSILRSFAEETEIYSIDEAFLDVSHTVGGYGTKQLLGKSIKDRIRTDTGLTCSVGIAPNKLVSKIAASLKKPDGLNVIEPQDVSALMEPLPVSDVPGIGPRLSQLLSDWGITLCRHIRQAGPDFFTERFGVRGRFLYDAACGVDNSPVVKTPPDPKSIGHSYTLPSDTRDTNLVRSLLFRLSEQVAERMRKERYYGRVVSLTIRMEDFTTFARRKKYREIPSDGKRIFDLAWAIFKEFSPNGAVRMAGVSVGELYRMDAGTLFPSERRRENLFFSVDGINSRFGDGTVFPATFLLERRLQAPVEKAHSFCFWRFMKSR